jgi:hypothetical protein
MMGWKRDCSNTYTFEHGTLQYKQAISAPPTMLQKLDQLFGFCACVGCVISTCGEVSNIVWTAIYF